MLTPVSEQRLSKFMTKLLRHTPGEFGLSLDPADGSCTVEALLQAIRTQRSWAWVTEEDLAAVVRRSEKQRFELRDGRIRARYGHSHDRVTYEPGVPPDLLYHGTNSGAAAEILMEGLSPMNRQYVHLSEGTGFASLAGSRRGELVILRVDTKKAGELGVTFYFAGNEVWLADGVPASCLAVHPLPEKQKGARPQ
ncbi:RNA 2'-phosphotransferase [Paenibacillus caseinilyticus]|uniref:Probable RNA 2'-phosphotransferase n=1 Tax=Paenibacillus mucilaginosus K02 TaxID=997761 RepID=I0BTE4_9BACL|nr:RNA 2'-phosphotransferase [Paenibacillus mucilaginosus]AFH65641.1 phosphotransferase [Paenibacillus mucilaginosus K02]